MILNYRRLLLNIVHFHNLTLISWKSDNPVSNTTVSWKKFGLFVTIKSMQVGLVGFLKHILSLIKCFRLQISQKSETVASVVSALRSTINIKSSCLDNKRSRILPIRFKCSDIKGFLGYMNSKGATFFSQIDFDKKNPSIVILVNISFEGILSRIYRSIPPPLLFLSNF